MKGGIPFRLHVDRLVRCSGGIYPGKEHTQANRALVNIVKKNGSTVHVAMDTIIPHPSADTRPGAIYRSRDREHRRYGGDHQAAYEQQCAHGECESRPGHILAEKVASQDT